MTVVSATWAVTVWWACARSDRDLLPGDQDQPVGPFAPGVQVVRHQGVALDPDADLPAAEDLGDEDHVPAQGDGAVPGHRPLELDHTVGLPRRHQRRRACRGRALRQQDGQVVDGQVRADRLDRVPATLRWIMSQSIQNRTT